MNENEFKEKFMSKIEQLEKQGQLELFMIERAIDECIKIYHPEGKEDE